MQSNDGKVSIIKNVLKLLSARQTLWDKPPHQLYIFFSASFMAIKPLEMLNNFGRFIYCSTIKLLVYNTIKNIL